MTAPSRAQLRPSRLLLTVGVVLAAVAAGGMVPALLGLLPATGTAGWAVVAGGDREVSSSAGLYKLYDGAAPDMMQAGISAAAQRVYSKGGKRLTVDVYKFANWQQAKAYYRKRQAELAGAKGYGLLPGVSNEAALAACGRTTVCYLWRKHYCSALCINGTSAAERAALTLFASGITNRIGRQH